MAKISSLSQQAAANTMSTGAQDQEQGSNQGQRKQSVMQVGVDQLRDVGILEDCKERLAKVGEVIRGNNALAFDMLYVDIPWKTINSDYLKSLPVKDLVTKDGVSGLLLWADSGNLLDAMKLIRAWGFTFHSVMHIVSYDNKVVQSNNPELSDPADGNGNLGTKTTSSSSKKIISPHGWQSDGITNSRSRQLLFAYAGDNSQDVNFTRIFKDFSFIRKRIGQISSFTYPEANTEAASTGLSSKKKNIENWVVYPNYDVYCPTHLRGLFETFVKPTTKVLSLFTSGLSKNWYSWGPNVPGYLNGPLRPDSGFALLCALQKYFSCMKTATVNKFLTLINLYIVQMAKQEGSLYLANGGSGGGDDTAKPNEPCIGTLVLQRFKEFLSDLQRKAESAGGVKDGPFGHLTLIRLKDLEGAEDLKCITKAQLLVQVAQVIKFTLRKIADAALHRKKVVKRKHDGTGDETESKASKTTTPRKYGIAAPVEISSDLATFMDVPPGTSVARTAVVKFINKYIVDNSLQNPERKSEILVEKDEKLLKLLNPDPNFGTVTYFNLCKLLGPHFVRNSTANNTTNNSGNDIVGEATPAPAVAVSG